MSTVGQRVVGFPVRFGGEEHTGWLPPGAAKPLPTSIRDVLLDVEIQATTGGYLLWYLSQDGEIHGDSWHDSVAQAVAKAEEWFGIPPRIGERAPPPPESAADHDRLFP